MSDSTSDLQALRERLAFAEQLLAGVAMANNTLLNIENYRDSIQKSLEILGQSTQVDRVYIFECHHVSESTLISQRWEWVAPGITPEIDNPDLQSFPFTDVFPRWNQQLSKGQVISGLIKDFPTSEREILELQDILSIVVAPISMGTDFWGFMGFDDCHRGHVWTPSEIDALKTVANSFGGAFARQTAETKLKQVNENLEARIQQRTAELETSTALANQANQAKSIFLANMSHELRTPLNGILGYAQILQRSEHLQEQEHAHTSIIEQCGQHLLTLINDVLDLSKIESQKMDIYPSEIHLESFLQSIIDIFSIQARQKEITLFYSFSPLLPEDVLVDKKRLNQVLSNLIGNAIKFTDMGKVEVKVSRTNLTKKKEQSKKSSPLCFEVHDTGPGISEEDVATIFSPFEQVGNIEKRSQGTGLGLAISQKIIAMMGGELQVTSTLGQGSIFSFEIDCPAVDVESLPASALSQGKILGYQGRPQKILIVDDRWENRAVLINMLAPLGFQICEAENGKQGFEQALAEQPNLIITDLFMPVMSGYEFMKRLRQHKATQASKVLVSSASVFQADQQKSLDAGGDYFLSKPIQFGELIQALSQVLHLEWIYEDMDMPTSSSTVETEGLEMQPMSPPSLETLLVLQKLALSGLIQNFCDELDKLDKISPDYRGFTQEYRALAGNFQLQKIKEALTVAIAQAQQETTEAQSQDGG